MIDNHERTAKLGPALALVGAVKAKDLKAIRTLRELVSIDDATASCFELLRRVYLIAELHIADEDAGAVATYCLDGRHTWPDVVIRWIDRSRRSLARRFAMSFATVFLGHYVSHSGYVDEDDDPMIPPELHVRLDRLAKRRANTWMLGLGYATTVILETITDYDRAELGERLTAYRAAAAKELLAAA